MEQKRIVVFDCRKRMDTSKIFPIVYSEQLMRILWSVTSKHGRFAAAILYTPKSPKWYAIVAAFDGWVHFIG